MSFARDWCGMREVAHISRLSVQLDKSDITNVCIMLLMTLNIIIITYFIYLYSSALAYVELELIHSHVRHHQMTNSNAVNLHRIISICTNGLILFNWVIIENTFSIQFRYIYMGLDLVSTFMCCVCALCGCACRIVCWFRWPSASPVQMLQILRCIIYVLYCIASIHSDHAIMLTKRLIKSHSDHLTDYQHFANATVR